MSNAKQEVEKLIGETLPFAKRRLLQHGEFHPFGAFMTFSGEAVHLAAEDLSTDTPAAIDLIEAMKVELRKRAAQESIRASAIVFDVSVTLPEGSGESDAIEIYVEHRHGYCAEVFYPYFIDESGDPTFGLPFAQQGSPSVFDV